MAMELVERTRQLAELESWLTEVDAGHGRMVLLGGEAGIGKSVLVEAFCQQHQRSARILNGACDSLSTPRPLGPLVDIARQTNGRVARALAAGAPRDEIFGALLDELTSGTRVTVLVIEDAHWADEATLDLLRFLARRLGGLQTLVIATYRDDEFGPRHPLRLVLGDLATVRTVRRLALPLLTEAGVSALAAGHGLDPVLLHRQTSGNPFFVSELLAAPASGIPETVRDAILARMTRLSEPARAALEAAAVIGFRSERWLLAALLGAEAGSIDECVELGWLRAETSTFAFRHELTRDAVLAAISPRRLLVWHRLALDALRFTANDADLLARLAHHAEVARDRAAVLEYAPAAARRAVSLAAHRQAAAQYARALRWNNEPASLERAALLEGYAHQCFLIERQADAVDAWNEALTIYRQAGNRLKEGEIQRLLTSPLWYLGRGPESVASARAALQVLESLPPGPELGWMYSTMCGMSDSTTHLEEAIAYGERAVAIAREIGDTSLLAHALTNLGCAQLWGGEPRGGVDLERALRIAVEAKLDEHAGRAYSNLTIYAMDTYQLALAERWIDEGIAYALDHDIETYSICLTIWRAVRYLFLGRLSEAGEIAQTVLRRTELSPMNGVGALFVLGRVRARRGDPEVADALDAALAFAGPGVDLVWRVRVRAARAEAAWLAGDHPRAAAEARVEYAAALAARDQWLVGELAYWLWRTGQLPGMPPLAAEPYARQLAGDWTGAAASWEALGCPYEAARALAESEDEAALRQALTVCNELEARPLALIITRKLRQLGVHGIARGPRPTTRANPAQLTAREMEIWGLLAGGLRNAEIADRLALSPKTVDHHVCAVLAKLGVHSRMEAARAMAMVTANAHEDRLSTAS